MKKGSFLFFFFQVTNVQFFIVYQRGIIIIILIMQLRYNVSDIKSRRSNFFRRIYNIRCLQCLKWKLTVIVDKVYNTPRLISGDIDLSLCDKINISCAIEKYRE